MKHVIPVTHEVANAISDLGYIILREYRTRVEDPREREIILDPRTNKAFTRMDTADFEAERQAATLSTITAWVIEVKLIHGFDSTPA